MKREFSLFLIAGLLATGGSASAEGYGSQETVSKKYQTEKTAENQGMNERDTELTRRVREQIVAQEDLSVNAKNVKIISQNGRITLKGTVDSVQERSKVGAIARKVSGAKSVVNQTEVVKE